MTAAAPPAAASDPLAGVRALRDHYARHARRATLGALPAGEPQRNLYDLVAHHVRQPGAKYLRPVLCLASCEAHGGRIDDALPAAAGLELLHTAFLIHDDIEDNSQSRRGQKSLPAQFGMELALNAGDALAAHAQHFVVQRTAALGARVSRILSDEFHRAVRETVEGQAIELGWRRDRAENLDVDGYVTMIAKKTAWYSVIAPLRIGAVIATRGRVDLDRLTPYGSLLGALYQVRNDLASVEQDFGGDGHGEEEDVLERKATLPLIHLMDPATPLNPAERRTLQSFYRGHADGSPADRAKAQQIVGMMRRRGSLATAAGDFWGLADAADARAASTFTHLPDTDARRLLESMPRLVRDGVRASRASAAGRRGP